MIKQKSKKGFATLFLIFILLASLGLFSQNKKEEADWKIAKEKNEITIYTRLMEGSKFKEYKAVCELDATPSKLVDILLNVKEYPKWMYSVTSADILERDGENIFFVYSEVKVPFPFDNRDQVTKSIVTRDSINGTQTIEVIIVPDYLPKNKGMVRMESGRGYWKFIPLKNGGTKTIHVFGGDPGGSIPSWIVNMFLVDGPIKTLTGLKEVIEE